jgi:shikimate kinase
MQRIFLIGYMGAGKTTIGKKLSVQMGLSYIDLDCFIEGRHHKTIRQIFEEKGEEYFREIEKNALREVAEFENTVISTGGGTPCFHGNMALMNTTGTTVYLNASVDDLMKHIGQVPHTRPVLKGLTGDGLRRFVETTLCERSRYYEQAGIIFPVEMMHTETDITRLVARLMDRLVNV